MIETRLFDRRQAKHAEEKATLDKTAIKLETPMITTSAASLDLNSAELRDNVSDTGLDTRTGPLHEFVERLHVDYQPSWKPDRRFSTPAVRYHRSSSPRRKKTIDNAKPASPIKANYRTRAASLPNNQIAFKRQRSPVLQPLGEDRSPSVVEQRFLNLPESAEYDKLRSFGVNARGELVDHGYCYRHRSDTSSSGSATGRSASPSEPDSPRNNSEVFPQPPKAPKKYNVLVIGSLEVGKTSLINTFQNCDMANIMGRGDSLEDETEKSLSVLISGDEVELSFTEFDILKHQTKQLELDSYRAVLVLYTVTSKKSFGVAADALYELHGVDNDDEEEVEGRLDGKILYLVGNKVDLERQRVVQFHDGKELAKSYDECKFMEISVALGHQTDELLKSLLIEIRRVEMEEEPLKHRRQRKGSSFKKLIRTSSSKKARSTRANSLHHHVGPMESLGRRLARSCEDLIARLWR